MLKWPREAKRGSGQGGETKRDGERMIRVWQRGIDELRESERERESEYRGWESKIAAGPNARVSRRMSFRVHDGVDALEACCACGGSFSSRSYVDRKTFHVTSSLDAQRAIVGEGSQGVSQPPDRSVSIPFFISFSKVLSPSVRNSSKTKRK